MHTRVMLKENDNKIYESIQNESKRQIEGIELIASENYVSSDVLEAMGSILTNKYSEGYSQKRYYGGNVYVDEIEMEAISRAKELFGAEHVNVQPYSGSSANLAVHLAFLQPGDKTMGMALDAGGHLTHGFKVSISGKYFNSVSYGVNSEGYIDYEEVERLALQHQPNLLWAGFSAYSREIDWKRFKDIANSVNAILVADIAHVAGLVAAGVYPSPIGIADIVTTTTHKTLRGPRGAMIMCNKEYAEVIDKAVFPGLQGGPHNHITAGIAVALKEAMTSEFKQYAKDVVENSKALCEALINNGYSIVSNGTDNHLFLVDVVKSVNLTGKEVSDILESVNITVNKNAIPNDMRKPWDPSGIRIGTAAITSRGMKAKDMQTVANFIDEALKSTSREGSVAELKEKVKNFTKVFPIPGIPDKL